MTFRRQIEHYCDAHGGVAPQPLVHPDLDDIPALPGWDEAARIVAAALHGRRATVVDLGARWGYLCTRLEAAGHDCVVLETDPEDLAFLRRLRTLAGARFEVVDGREATELPGLGAGRPSLVAAGWEPGPAREVLPRLVELAAALEPLEAFVTLPAEPQRAGPAQSLPGGDTVSSLLAEGCGFTRREFLGQAPGIGAVYRLS
jgi:hypothetical protein